MHSPWLCWLYHYGVGGGLFVAGWLLAFRTGAARWSLWTDRWLAWVLIAGDRSVDEGIALAEKAMSMPRAFFVPPELRAFTFLPSREHALRLGYLKTKRFVFELMPAEAVGLHRCGDRFGGLSSDRGARKRQRKERHSHGCAPGQTYCWRPRSFALRQYLRPTGGLLRFVNGGSNGSCRRASRLFRYCPEIATCGHVQNSIGSDGSAVDR